MASIVKRDGMYVARWRTPQGGSRQRTFALQRDAQAHLDQVTADKRGSGYIDSVDSRQTFGAWYATWSASRINLKGSTEAKVDSLARVHVLPAFRDRPLSEITQPEVAAWVASMVRGGSAPATVHAAYQLLAKSLRHAVAARALRMSPCVEIELPTIHRDEMRYLDHGDVARLAAAMPEQYRALTLLLAYSGLRIGEAASLRRHRLRLLDSKGSVTVASNAAEVRGRWIEQTPKTTAARRSVPLPAPVVQALREHVARYAQPEADGLVFTAPEGGPLRVATWRRRVWTPATREAGLDPLRIHDLRHTAVALWISSGADLLTLKRWAGHTRSSFTIDRYGHLFEDDSAALVDRIAARMEPVRSAGVVALRQ